MNKLSYILLVFGLLGIGFLANSCQEVIVLDIDEGDPVIVIEGWITSDSVPYTITVHQSAPINSGDSVLPIMGAKVVIRDDVGNSDYLTEVSPGKYQTDSLIGVLLRNYDLEVDINGEIYTSSTYIPRINPIDALPYFWNDGFLGLDSGYVVAFLAQEPPGVGDYYRFFFTVNDSLYDGKQDLFYTDDSFGDGTYTPFPFFFYPVDSFDTVKIEIMSIPIEAYDYFITLQEIWQGAGSPFAAPPDNPKGNISNGALGFFGGGGMARRTTVVVP